MKLINKYFVWIIIIIMLLIGCSEEKILLISNTPSNIPDQNYKLNLKSDSGENLNSVTISWNETDYEVNLVDSNTSIKPTGNSHPFGMNPGEFKEVSIQVITDDTIYEDTIQIFTRPVYPVTNFEYKIEEVMRGNEVYDEGESFTDLGNGIWNDGEYYTDANDDEIWNSGETFTDLGNGTWNAGEEFIDIKYPKYHRILKWTTTNELSANFSNYILYRVKSEEIDELVNSECNTCKIDVLNSLLDSTYVDSSINVIDESGIAAFYYMVQVTTGNSTKNSFIYNYNNFTQLGLIQLTTGDVSTDKKDYIDITWESISNSNFFYQYEIYRALGEELSDTSLVAIIPHYSIEYFQDRKAGNGTTWFYSVAVVDINGGKNFSNFISGWTMP